MRGYAEDEVYVYKGIPYGASTGGDGRFQPPRKPEPWRDVRDCLQYGPVSPMWERSYGERAAFFQGRDLGRMGEDCLRLNVWTRGLNDRAKRPVMFWLHEGGFFLGSSQEHAAYDGANLARRDVVVITINHRLNVFGFLNLANFGEKYVHSGNIGLLDIVAALQWVKENIAGFGGDPDNVTLFGHSGGGAKINYLLTMPTAKGLFHKAIAQSPEPRITTWKSPDETSRLAVALVSALGLSPDRIDDLQTMPFDRVANAALKVLQGAKGALAILPSVDGNLLPEPPFMSVAPEASKTVPLMVGTTMRESGAILRPMQKPIDEAALRELASQKYGSRASDVLSAFRAAYPTADRVDLWGHIDSFDFRKTTVVQAQRKAAQAAAPAYLYLFAWRTQVLDGLPRAFHGSEVPFVFDNTDLAASMTGGTEEARELAGRVSAAWVSFARNGNPNHKGLPNWSPLTTKRVPTMVFDNVSEVKVDQDAEALSLTK